MRTDAFGRSSARSCIRMRGYANVQRRSFNHFVDAKDPNLDLGKQKLGRTRYPCKNCSLA